MFKDKEGVWVGCPITITGVLDPQAKVMWWEDLVCDKLKTSEGLPAM